MNSFISPFVSRSNGVVFACTVGNAVSITPMVFTVFGLFLLPIATEFNWGRSEVSIVLLIISVAGAVSYPIVGRTIDRFGARPVILAGNVLFAGSVALVSLTAASRLQFYSAFVLIGIAGAIPSSVMFTKVIAGWFDRNRGFFLGFVGGVGNGTGAAIAPAYVHMLISEFGWRGAYQGIGVAILLIGFPVLFLFLRDPPRAAAADAQSLSGMSFPEARRTGAFWSILAAIALGAGCVTAVFAHIIPMLTDRGISVERATAVLATFGLVTAVWQVVMGIILDRFPRPWIAVPFYLSALAGLVLLELSSQFALLICAGVLLGLGLGTEYGVLPYFLSRYFGVKHYGAISGTVYGVIILAQGIAPFLMDLVFDITGTYQIAVVTIAAGLLAGAALIARLPPFHVYGQSVPR